MRAKITEIYKMVDIILHQYAADYLPELAEYHHTMKPKLKRKDIVFIVNSYATCSHKQPLTMMRFRVVQSSEN